MFLLFYSGYSVFILCIHWPIAMFDVYDFNLCVFYHVLGQRWPNKRVQSVILETYRYSRTSLMSSQSWFRLCLGTFSQQAVTWANIDADLLSPYGVPRPQGVRYRYTHIMTYCTFTPIKMTVVLQATFQMSVLDTKYLDFECYYSDGPSWETGNRWTLV